MSLYPVENTHVLGCLASHFIDIVSIKKYFDPSWFDPLQDLTNATDINSPIPLTPHPEQHGISFPRDRCGRLLLSICAFIDKAPAWFLCPCVSVKKNDNKQKMQFWNLQNLPKVCLQEWFDSHFLDLITIWSTLWNENRISHFIRPWNLTGLESTKNASKNAPKKPRPKGKKMRFFFGRCVVFFHRRLLVWIDKLSMVVFFRWCTSSLCLDGCFQK